MREKLLLVLLLLALLLGLVLLRAPESPSPTTSTPPSLPELPTTSIASGADNTLEIGTWNLAWFGDGDPATCPNERRFPRDDAVLQELAKYLDSLDIEVLALQEVEDQEALERLLRYLPEGKYGYVVSPENLCQRTAVLYQKDEVEVQFQGLIDALAVSRFLRKGLVVKVNASPDLDFLMVVVHLKCCEGFENEAKRRRQLEVLNQWVKSVLQDESQDHDIVLIGDFNEQFLSRPDMLSVLTQGTDLELLTDDAPSIVCSPEEKVYRDPIDHILVTKSLLSRFTGTVRMEDVYENPSIDKSIRDRFSDHCPLWAQFSLTGEQAREGGEGPVQEEPLIVINEFDLNPPCDDRYSTCIEPVELYNPNDEEVDISGWKITAKHGSENPFFIIPQGTKIPAHGFYLIKRANWLDNENEWLELQDSKGQVVHITPKKSDDKNDERSWQRCSMNGKEEWKFRKESFGEPNDC